MVNAEGYRKILKSIILTWPVWKRKLANEELIISLNSVKIPETSLTQSETAQTRHESQS